MFYLCSYNPCNAPLQLCALKSTISGLVPTYYIPMQHVRATPAYVRLKLTDTPATEPPWTTWRIVFGEGAAHYWAHKQSDSTLLWSPSPQKLMHTTDQSSAVKKCSCPKSSAQISCVVPQELEPGGLPWPASADEDQNLFTHTFSWSAICNLTSSDTTWWGAATACKRSWGRDSPAHALSWFKIGFMDKKADFCLGGGGLPWECLNLLEVLMLLIAFLT